MLHPPRPTITTRTTTTMVDGQGKSVEIKKRRGEATRTIGMDMKPAAAARPTAPAARAGEAEEIMPSTGMEGYTVGRMGWIAIMSVWYAPIATPTTTPTSPGITAWTATPGTSSD